MRRRLLFTALSLAGAAQGHAVCFVNGTAAGANTGTTWSDAYQDLNSALTDSHCGSIWVARGVYTPTKGSDRKATFRLLPGQSVYGGFAGSEDALDERNLTTNVSVLSGDIDQNDANVATTQIDSTPADISGSNAYNVVTIDGASGAPVNGVTVLDGFTITGGDTGAPYFFTPGGGGLICSGAGSGQACSPTLSNLTFLGNRATKGQGGAVLLDGSYGGESSPVLSRVSFEGNEASEGAGVYGNAKYSGRVAPTISNATFEGNIADGDGGGIATTSYYSGTVSITIASATFHSNVAQNSGGAISVSSQNYGTSTLDLSDAVFSSNSTKSTILGDGGAISVGAYDGNDTVAISRTSFIENYSLAGGAVSCGGQNLSVCTLRASNSTFANNTAQTGGALFMFAETYSSSDVQLNNVTFSGNIAVAGASWPGSGGAISAVGSPLTWKLQIGNSIFWNDVGSVDNEVSIDNVDATIQSSVVAGGCPAGVTCASTTDKDPLLEPLGYHWGYTPVMRPGLLGSAIDAGDDATCELTDQRNFARPMGAHCDIGAVEMRLPSDDFSYPGGF
ncbi:MAG TPA: choice-of-anchor Q domain-containing protein [Rudaea sp.]|jgi:predicted outer membrane repeat protein|nr:choice-of-anchor Q domain-containing protein [Rudaea sp.]